MALVRFGSEITILREELMQACEDFAFRFFAAIPDPVADHPASPAFRSARLAGSAMPVDGGGTELIDGRLSSRRPA